MNAKSPSGGTRSRIPALLCLGVLCGILLAGLWPFRGPRNGVTWLANQDGVRLSRHATLWTSGSFPLLDLQNGDSCSLELWLRPRRIRDSNTILAFSTPEDKLQLTLHQYVSLLILQTGVPGTRRSGSTIGIDEVFHEGKPVFVAISSGPLQTVMYVDGAQRRVFGGYSIGKYCAGRLVLGTSPIMDESWHGELQGLALFGQELMPAQIVRHYQTWAAQGRPDLSDAERVAALYLFNEHAGKAVHNEIPGGMELYIPERYALVHQIFLRPFWEEFRPTWSCVEDILVNIAGLIPFGFVFFAYLSSVRSIKHAALITTALGFAASLTIEVVQSRIPTRDSGTTDLFTNTLGTFLGVRLYGWSFARSLFARLTRFH